MVPNIKDYTILEMIAEGKHTMIFRAQRKTDDKPVIIKLLKREDIIPKNVEKLTHEFDLLSKLKSEHVVRAYDLISIQNSLLLVEEDFQAQTLASVIEDQGMDLLNALEASIAIAEAVGDIHHQHIIHKDIKPQNILINAATNQIKIIDFGIATQLSREVQQVLNPEQLEGSIAYMSPEQTGRMNRPVDYRSDIYSLGITLYQLFTKKLPFEAESPLELIHFHIAQKPIPPNEIDASIPKPISDIVLKCMSKEAEHRYNSAFGLKKDLEKCREALLRTSTIPPFIPGEQDVFDHFHYPEKLHGRQKELHYINQCFNEVWGGATLLLGVSGYPGIGKTSLILESQKQITAKNGRFVQAKIDQFKRNLPYNSLIQIFHTLIHQILGESDEVLAEWKVRILEAVGDNGQVITDVIPELKLIIGDQPPVEKLPPQDNANRFNYVMVNFLKAMLIPEQPLVIFVDDFHWVDEPSLKILELFYNDPGIKYLLFIIAYRDTEVSTYHPMQIALKEISAKGGKVLHLNLKPLSQEAIQEMIQNAFYGPPKQTEEFANLLYRKTQGNPYFTLQLLKLLYEKELFYFDKVRCCWMAKMDQIAEAQVSDNVADILLDKLKNTKPEVIELLKIASAAEVKFDQELLAQISQISADKIAQLLNQALQEELLMEERGEGKGRGERGKISYRFIHDRIQQAVYSFLSDEEKAQLHYKIGRYKLEQESSPEKLQEQIIDIVSHLNFAKKEWLKPEEREELVKLNLAAGLKAKESVAYVSAIQYFAKGIEMLPENPWETDFDNAMALHNNLALCLTITGGAKQAEPLFDQCLMHARTDLEKAEIYKELILLLSQLQDYPKCFDTAVKGMAVLGHNFNPHPSKLALIKDLLKLKVRMHFNKLEDIENMPLATDLNFDIITSFLAGITYPAFVTGNKILFLRNSLNTIDMTLDYGVNRRTPVALATYAMVLGSSMFKDYETSSKYGETAIQLANRFPRTVEKAGAYYMYYAFIHRWKYALRTSIPPLKQNFRALLETGGGAIAAANAVYISLIALVTGDKLDNVLETVQEGLAEIKKFSSSSEENSMAVHKEVCLALKGLSHDCTDPRPKEFTEELLASTSNTQNLLFLLRYEVWHIVLLYLFGKYEEALAIGKKVLTKTDNYPNWIEWHVFYFFHALALAATLKTPKDNPANWKLLKEHYKKLQDWAKASPINYAHYELIVAAEISRIQGSGDETIKCFERAIDAAKKSECTQDIAIAYELFGKYYQSQNFREMTSIFLHKALQYYSLWGAEAKCLDFKNTFAEYLTLETLALSAVSMQDLSFLTTTAHTKTTVSQTASTRKSESTARSADSDFDVNALIDASQALSKEIVLDKLMESLMHVVIVNAGADKAFLILFDNKKAMVYSQVYLNEKYVPLITPIPVEDKQAELCLAIIKYVTRTQTDLLLNNALDEGNFRYDPYVLNMKPKSILCLPLMQKGGLKGILYLENTATRGVFTPKRMRLLSLLSSQMAIAIENAQFYGKLESKVLDRTKELQQRNQELQHALQTIKNVQQQMIQQEKLASLGLLTSGIAHELKNPLNFVINFSQIAQEYVDELQSDLKQNHTLKEDKLETLQELRDALGKIDTHGKRADGIIKGMLMHAHQSSNTAEKVDLNALIDQAVNLTYHTYRKKDSRFNLTINKNYDPNLSSVNGFPGDLLRVFINIIDNACYSLLDKLIKNAESFKPAFDIKTFQENKNVHVILRDNGPGIPKQVIEKIFEPFFTTKPAGSGTGLGLSIVYDIITKQHGGTIAVKSEPDAFTEFELTFPLPEEIPTS